jgi:hypothetical protein
MYQPPAQTILKAEGILFAIEKLTGARPYIRYSPSGADIYFTPAQVASVRPVVTALLEKKPAPGDNINIHAAPIVAPIILKKAAPFVLGILVVGYILGKL